MPELKLSEQDISIIIDALILAVYDWGEPDDDLALALVEKFRDLLERSRLYDQS